MAAPAQPIRTVLTVIKKISDAAGIRVLSLRDPDDWELPPARPGSHINIHLPNGLVRTYSLCGDSYLRDEYTIAVKKAAPGRGGSAFIHDQLKAGDHVRVSLPRCTFPTPDPCHKTIFIAGGIGLTPFLSMAYELDRLEGNYELHLFHRGPVPLKAELGRIGKAGKVILHERSRNAQCATIGELLGQPHPDLRAYCCGPLPMIRDFEQAVAHWDPSRFAIEYFAPPAQAPLDNAFTVVLKQSGLTLEVPPDSSVLHAIQSAGIALESACEGGICGACKVRWLEGEPIHRDLCLSDAERAHYFMPCVGGCNSPRLVIDL